MARHKTPTLTIIILAATGLFLTMATASVLNINIDLAAPTNGTGTTETGTSGTINTGQLTTVNVKVYQDQACTQPLTFIDWGNITVGESANKTIHIKNAGTVPITLNMTSKNWNPPHANKTMTVKWDKEGTSLTVNHVEPATLTLEVMANTTDITHFTVDIAIVGTG